MVNDNNKFLPHDVIEYAQTLEMNYVKKRETLLYYDIGFLR